MMGHFSTVEDRAESVILKLIRTYPKAFIMSKAGSEYRFVL